VTIIKIICPHFVQASASIYKYQIRKLTLARVLIIVYS
jgi:hypothetical protein